MINFKKENKMLPLFISILCIFGSALGNGELVIFHAPQSVKFVGAKPLPADLIPDVVTACMGFSTSADSTWPGLIRVSPFQSARLAVIYSLDGPSARLPGEVARHASSIARYPLIPSPGHGPYTWWSALQHAAKQREMMLNSTAEKIVLDSKPSEGETAGLELGSLSAKVDEDRAWLREIQSLRSLIMKASTDMCRPNNGPSILWLESTALHALSDLHGAGSPQAKDASKMLGTMLAALSEELQTACDGKVLFAAITSDASHTRRTRSVLQVKDEKMNEHNLASQYDKNFPVMFNIFLFFGIIFVFSLIAISMAIATMDPGRDSIIYRMTNPRMKKDN